MKTTEMVFKEPLETSLHGRFLHHIMDEMAFLEEQRSAITYDDLVQDEVLKRSGVARRSVRRQRTSRPS
jgi:hypothetical protein